jgi:hypothetical protein
VGGFTFDAGAGLGKAKAEAAKSRMLVRYCIVIDIFPLLDDVRRTLSCQSLVQCGRVKVCLVSDVSQVSYEC